MYDYIRACMGVCVCIHSNVFKSDFLKERWKTEEEHCVIHLK